MVQTRFQARLESLHSLQDLLPRLLENLSLARAQIALDQVRTTLQNGEANRVVLVTAGECSDSKPPLAAAIAIGGPQASPSDQLNDAATMVHAGALQPILDAEIKEIGIVIANQMDQLLHDRGIRFVQWSTDDDSHRSSDSVSTWCSALGFRSLATLEYLSAPLPIETSCQQHNASTLLLHHQPLNWSRRGELDEFAELVEQTYVDTRDCPMLADYRTAMQTLRGYQSSGAFAPSLWFRLIDPESNESLGCLVLGLHQRKSRGDDPGGEDVAEIVYMGLVPHARGRGLGSAIMRIVNQVALGIGCSRLLLAVDQRNHPAKSIYDSAGLQSVICETVWVKSI